MHHILLDSNGLILRKRNKCFYIESKKRGNRMVSPNKVKTITISADVLISNSAIILATDFGIPIFYMKKTGRVYAKTVNKNIPGKHTLRLKQVLFSFSNKKFTWIEQVLKLKSKGQLELLKDKLTPTSDLKNFEIKQEQLLNKLELIKDEKSNRATILSNYLVIEAQLGKLYWANFRKILPGGWVMKSRSTRPAEDPINATINYCYGFHYAMVEQALYLEGLDPTISIFHQNKYNDAVLSYDVIEPFRPLADRFVYALFEEKYLSVNDYDFTTKGVIFNRAGKQLFLPKFFEFLEIEIEFNNEIAQYKNHIFRYANQLKLHIDKTIDTNDYIDRI